MQYIYMHIRCYARIGLEYAIELTCHTNCHKRLHSTYQPPIPPTPSLPRAHYHSICPPHSLIGTVSSIYHNHGVSFGAVPQLVTSHDYCRGRLSGVLSVGPVTTALVSPTSPNAIPTTIMPVTVQAAPKNITGRTLRIIQVTIDATRVHIQVINSMYMTNHSGISLSSFGGWVWPPLRPVSEGLASILISIWVGIVDLSGRRETGNSSCEA